MNNSRQATPLAPCQRDFAMVNRLYLKIYHCIQILYKIMKFQKVM